MQDARWSSFPLFPRCPAPTGLTSVCCGSFNNVGDGTPDALMPDLLRLIIVPPQHPSVIEYIGLGAVDHSSPEAEWRTMYLVQEVRGMGRGFWPGWGCIHWLACAAVYSRWPALRVGQN